MENSSGINAGQQIPIEFQRVPKRNCKHCFGRGWERYLAARVLNTDGSITEQFEAVDCRCVKMIPVCAGQVEEGKSETTGT